MKNKFKSGTDTVKHMAISPDALANEMYTVFQPLLPTYYRWGALSYDERKEFVRDAIGRLLARFGDDNLQPQILFREDLQVMLKPGLQLPIQTAAFCYIAGHSQKNDMVIASLCKNPPRAAFGFLHDLSASGMLVQIAHEFTHFLQHAGKSSLSLEEMQAVWNNYVRPEEDMATYRNQIVEREAVAVGNSVCNMIQAHLETIKKIDKGKQND